MIELTICYSRITLPNVIFDNFESELHDIYTEKYIINDRGHNYKKIIISQDRFIDFAMMNPHCFNEDMITDVKKL